MKSILSPLFLSSMIILSCQNKSENDAQIAIIKRTLSYQFMNNRRILEQIKESVHRSPNSSDYEFIVDSVKIIFEEKEKAFVIDNYEVQVRSVHSIKNYENFLEKFIKKYKMAKIVNPNIETITHRDTTDLNFWIHILQISQIENSILLNYASRFSFRGLPNPLINWTKFS
jgi:translation initiation factor 2 beta subunit (eIF-2beta)/eIF-5